MKVLKIKWDDFYDELDIKKNDTNYIYISDNVLTKLFPNLNSDDFTFLLENYIKVINFVLFKMSDKTDNLIMFKQLKQNNNMDLVAILQLILPFIDEKSSSDPYSLKKKLRSLRDLYLKMDNNKYVFTNSQYNRCIRYVENNKLLYEKRPYMRNYLENHVDLLLMSIESCTNKLYVNWVDIAPVQVDKTSLLYINTLNKIKNNTTDVKLLNGYLDTSRNSVSFCDIYNVIANHLYLQIKSIKWLIYDYVINNQPVSCIKYLQQILALDNIYNGKLWSLLSINEKHAFENSWDKLINDKNQVSKHICINIYYFFCKNYKDSKRLLKNKQLIYFPNPTMIYDPINDVAAGFKNTNMEDIYMFFFNVISEYKKTWYYYASHVDKNNFSNKYSESFITLKNVYNFAKSITHIVDTTGLYSQLPNFWYSLNSYYVDLFLIRLLDIDNKEFNDWTKVNWFNNKSFIKKLNPDIKNKEVYQKNKELYNSIKDCLTDVIMESLMYHGLLSEFKPQEKISDDQLIEKIINTKDDEKIKDYKRSQIKEIYFETNIEKYSNCFYYPTITKYKDIPKIVRENGSKTYFEEISSERQMEWTFTYAMNWISQINFFHHYSNLRVMYVTGSTGVGKSTQVPKLLMYSQIMIDYNQNGKIICSQPRVTPTVKNAEIISQQLAYPIVQFDNEYKQKTTTGNYTIQYQYKGNSHNFSSDATTLKIVTDGILYNVIKRSPFLTKTTNAMAKLYNNTNPNGTYKTQIIDWAKTFTSENIYDIVIVDEAHEHNSNMDMILTLMRDTLNLNNSLKLVIVSATMEDDEPIYRRYYRDVNDNRAYPLNNYIVYNQLDRCNIDRRIHISPPGQTTQYKINDHYLSTDQVKLVTNKNESVNASVKQTIDLVATTTKGDILLFLPGQKEIKDAVVAINKQTPLNVICLPFYSEMNDRDKKFIEDIESELKNYIGSKSDVLSAESIVDKMFGVKVAPGTYTRAVIVATNVAEASLTLPSLRYVVDCGYSKINIFNPITDEAKLTPVLISNSSSQQRRGRVGRVASGDVYYMYTKNDVSERKTQYVITNADTTDMFIDLLQVQEADIPIISLLNNINSIYYLEQMKKQKASVEYSLDRYIKDYYSFLTIINKRYLFIKDKLRLDTDNFYLYYGKSDSSIFGKANYRYSETDFENNHDDYNYRYNIYSDDSRESLARDTLSHRKYTGFPHYKLIDDSLNFYLIHPDENIIVRDLHTGKFIGFKYLDEIDPEYYDKVFELNGVAFTKSDCKNAFTNYLEVVNHSTYKSYKGVLINNKLMNNSFIRLASNGGIGFSYINSNFTYNSDKLKYFDQLKASNIGSIYVKSDLITHINTVHQKITSKYKATFTLKDATMYCYSIVKNCNNDILGLILLINTFPSLADIFVKNKLGAHETNKYTSDKNYVEKIMSIHSNCKNDISFFWKIWVEIKHIIENSNINAYTTISPYPDSNYLNLKENYKNKTGSESNRNLFKKLAESNKLNTKDEYYDYIKEYKPEDNFVISGSKINSLINNICNKYLLDYDKIHKFITTYISSLFEINRIKFIEQYDNINNVDTDDPDKLDIEWIVNNMQYNSVIFKNPQSNFEKICEIYIKTFLDNVVVNKGGYYFRLTDGLLITKKYFFNIKEYEATFSGQNNEFYVFIKTSSNKHEDTCIDILIPIKFEWILAFNKNMYYNAYSTLKNADFKANMELIDPYSILSRYF